MRKVTIFNWKLDKKRIFQILDCQEGSTLYNKLNSLFSYFQSNIQQFISPLGIYDYIDTPTSFKSITGDCSKIVICFLTLGEKVSTKINNFFAAGQYLEAILLDVMANEILFKMSEQLYSLILMEVQERGRGLSGRIQPGHKDVPLALQKEILDNLTLEGLNVSINSSNMLWPLKSLTFFSAVNKDRNSSIHTETCLNCNMSRCEFREDKLITLTIVHEGKQKELKIPPRKNLLTILKENNINIRTSCGANGNCGKCVIRVIKGQLRETPADLKFLSPEEVAAGLRLACFAYPEQDITIEIRTVVENDFWILNSFLNQHREAEGIIEQIELDFIPEEIKSEESLVQFINEKTKADNTYSLHSLVELSGFLNKYYENPFKNNIKNKFYVIRKESHILDIQTAEEKEAYGIAVDLGTTTIVVCLVDLINRRVVESYALLNSQRKYGEDVITRITYSSQGYLDDLKNTVRKDILVALKKLLKKAKVNTRRVYSLVMINRQFKYKTIGNSPPLGICSSGVVDIVAVLLDNDLIDRLGNFQPAIQQGYIKIAKNNKGEDIIFTQKDIQEVQLAKAAIRSGIEILLSKLSITHDQIKTVYIAGGFGTNLNIDSAIKIGLFPKEFKEKITVVGNSSLGGAVTYLLNKSSRERIESIRKKTKNINISLVSDFNNLFLENMFLKKGGKKDA